MGAAASIEMVKPLDASDIRSTESVEVAVAEVRRLRAELGHLAKQAGIDIVIYDASDLILGDGQDFNRCIDEISHIRRLCAMNTNSSRRKTRTYNYDDKPVFVEPIVDEKDEESDESSSND